MKLKHLAAVAALLVPFAATADSNFKYVELSMLSGTGSVEGSYNDLDTVGVDADIKGEGDIEGFDFRIMAQFGDNWIMSIRTADMEVDGGSNFTDLFIGAGYAFNFTDSLTAYGLVGIAQSEVPFVHRLVQGSGDGFGVDLGVLFSMDAFEFGAHYANNPSDSHSFEGASNLGVSAAFHFTDNLSVVGRYETFEYGEGKHTVGDTNSIQPPGDERFITTFEADYLSIGIRGRF